jgi:hypothetical protein
MQNLSSSEQSGSKQFGGGGNTWIKLFQEWPQEVLYHHARAYQYRWKCITNTFHTHTHPHFFCLQCYWFELKIVWNITLLKQEQFLLLVKFHPFLLPCWECYNCLLLDRNTVTRGKNSVLHSVTYNILLSDSLCTKYTHIVSIYYLLIQQMTGYITEIT